MKKVILFRKSISIGQKTSIEKSVYGQGFNYVVEAGFALGSGFQREKCLRAFESALGSIDHKALGVDADLGIEPTTGNLCSYLANAIRNGYPLGAASLKLKRGDGLEAMLVVSAGAL